MDKIFNERVNGAYICKPYDYKNTIYRIRSSEILNKDLLEDLFRLCECCYDSYNSFRCCINENSFAYIISRSSFKTKKLNGLRSEIIKNLMTHSMISRISKPNKTIVNNISSCISIKKYCQYGYGEITVLTINYTN